MIRAGTIVSWVVRLFAVALAGWAAWQAFPLLFAGFDETGALHEGALLVIATSSMTFALALVTGWYANPFGRALARAIWPAGTGMRWLALVVGVAGLCLFVRGLLVLSWLPTARLILRGIAQSAELQRDESWILLELTTNVAVLAGGALLVFIAARIGARATA